ncbi:MAG: hypothetical protein AVDCRST_MAG93-2381 [uncultured Chloroflexia bacterium]|uniref:Aminoglycoside phosphotransferase domain-containing protein n=1 Tax=uncultured Chloroflexia bacterium TaxID=1672391 RepID=A0A6J4IYK3_9CHLR|nr:MAG: hypothetical protein AVDCRST_MAG93-2381 [uncultured Chloroflexia bacterium]
MIDRYSPLTIDWARLFPPGARVLAIPNWDKPRLLAPAHHFYDRWRGSSFYPASRPQARIYRAFLRTKAAMRLVESRTVPPGDWLLYDFVREVLPQTAAVDAVLIGSGGLAQKLTVRLRDKSGEVIGYLKYGEKEASRRRLLREFHMLSGIGGVAPEPLKYGTLGRGEALLIAPLVGRAPRASLTPAGGVEEFFKALTVLPPMPLEDHPWVQDIRHRSGGELDHWLEDLADREWPVVVQHGDFAPWNLLRRPNGTLGAIDWEYGTLEGFPYLDLAYHMLHTSALIYRWPPARAVEYTDRYLSSRLWTALRSKETLVLTRLAAYDAYLKGLEDGKRPSGIQSWRRRVWEDSE